MKKDLLVVATLILILTVLFLGTEIQTVEEYYLIHSDDILPDSELVYLSIDARRATEKWDELPTNLREYLPKDGWILKTQTLVLRPGDTAFSILQRATRKNRIPLDFQGADQNIYGSVYIKGIQHLYEFQLGNQSGWMYSINEVFPDRGMSRYVLSDGDVIKLIYTTALGRDLDVDFLEE